MPNSFDSENRASLRVTPSAQVDERVLWTYLSSTRRGKAVKMFVSQLDISESKFFQSVLDCLVNELVCLC